eukprot:8803439-Karenia_brevis.AAC.2
MSRHRGAFPMCRAEDMSNACSRAAPRQLSSSSGAQSREAADEAGTPIDMYLFLLNGGSRYASGVVLPSAPRRESAMPVLAVA